MTIARTIKRAAQQPGVTTTAAPSDTRGRNPDTAEKLEGAPERSATTWSCRADNQKLSPLTQLDADDPRRLVND